MRKSFLVFAILCFSSLLLAQQSLNNESVIKLVKAGLSDDLIVSTVNASPGSYDTSADGIIALKTAGVSDKVVAAIVVKVSAPAPSTANLGASAIAPLADPDNPSAPHDPGVYLCTVQGGKQKLIFIDRAGSGREKTAGVAAYAFTYGIAKAKVKAEIPGPHASVRSADSKPVFYMFFPSASNLGGFGGNDVITSPAQFALLSLEEKKDHRETAVAKVGFGSMSAGTDNKRATLFATERIRNGVYKLTSNSDLKTGEYAFIASTGTSGPATSHTVVIYDFGVDAK